MADTDSFPLVKHCRWVTFTGELGDLDLIAAYPYSWEVQSVVTSGGDPTPLGGSFTVEFGGYVSEDLPYDASADGVKAALEALPSTGMVDVNQTVLDNGQNEWWVTFRDLVGGVDMIVVDGTGLTGTSASIDASEVCMSVSNHPLGYCLGGWGFLGTSHDDVRVSGTSV